MKGLSSTHPGVLHALIPCIPGRVAKWQRYGRYICVKLLKGKKCGMRAPTFAILCTFGVNYGPTNTQWFLHNNLIWYKISVCSPTIAYSGNQGSLILTVYFNTLMYCSCTADDPIIGCFLNQPCQSIKPNKRSQQWNFFGQPCRHPFNLQSLTKYRFFNQPCRHLGWKGVFCTST